MKIFNVNVSQPQAQLALGVVAAIVLLFTYNLLAGRPTALIATPSNK